MSEWQKHKVAVMSEWQKHKVLLWFVLLAFVSTHYILWLGLTDPLPDHGGKFEFYYPVLNYLQIAKEIGNDLAFIRRCDFEYSYGVSLLSWLVVSLDRYGIIAQAPFFLNIICLLLFVLSIFFFRGRKNAFLTSFLICFFPLSQVCIKQFSLHGWAVAGVFLGILFFRSFLLKKHWYLCFGFISLFWFAALLKLTGLILLLNVLVVYVFWAVGNRCFSFKIFCLLLLPLLLLLPFYDIENFSHYVLSSLYHNPYIAQRPFVGTVVFAICVVLLLSLPPVMAICLRTRVHKQVLVPKVFRAGWLFAFIFLISCAIVAYDLFSPLSLFLLGYGILLPFLWRFHFRGVRGFMYLYAFLTLVPMLILFRSGIGHMAYVIYLPLLLMFLQVVLETNSHRFRVTLTVLVLLAANFFPSFESLDKLFGFYGREIYLTLFHGPHQNPLGWQNYGFGQLKRAFIAELSKYSFSEKPLFIVENFGPFTSAQFAFYPNVLYKFPPMPILELLEDGKVYRELYQRYLQEGGELFATLWESRQIPVLFFADPQPMNERGFQPLLLDELIQEHEFSIETENDDLFVWAFNQSLINYLQQSGHLKEHYICHDIPVNRVMATVCVDKRLQPLDGIVSQNYGQEYLRELKNRKIQELLDKAWQCCHHGQPMQSHNWLKKALKLDSDSREVQKDLQVIGQMLWEKYAYNVYRKD